MRANSQMTDLENIKKAVINGNLTESDHTLLLELQASDYGWTVAHSFLEPHEAFVVQFSGAAVIYSKLRNMVPGDQIPNFLFESLLVKIKSVLLDESLLSKQELLQKLLRCLALLFILLIHEKTPQLLDIVKFFVEAATHTTITTIDAVTNFDTLTDDVLLILVYFCRAVSEEISSALERSDRFNGIQTQMQRNCFIATDLFKSILLKSTNSSLLIECIAACSEWLDVMITDAIFVQHSDFVDLIYELMLRTHDLYVSGCDALVKLLDCGHCGLEAEACTKTCLSHQLQQLTKLRTVFFTSLEQHAVFISMTDDDEIGISKHEAIIDSTVRLLAALSELQMEQIVSALVEHSADEHITTFFEMLMAGVSVTGCFPLDEAYSASLLEPWFSFQKALLTHTTGCQVSCSEDGIQQAYTIYLEYLSKLMVKLMLPDAYDLIPILGNEQWHDYRKDIVNAFLEFLSHEPGSQWLLSFCTNLLGTMREWESDFSKGRELEAFLFLLGGLSEELVISCDRLHESLTASDNDVMSILASLKLPIGVVSGTVLQVINCVVGHLTGGTDSSKSDPLTQLLLIASVKICAEYYPLLELQCQLASRGVLRDASFAWTPTQNELFISALSMTSGGLRTAPPVDYSTSNLLPSVILWLNLVSTVTNTLCTLLERTEKELSLELINQVTSGLVYLNNNLNSIGEWCQPASGQIQRRIFWCFGRLLVLVCDDDLLHEYTKLCLEAPLSEANRLAHSFCSQTVSQDELVQSSGAFGSRLLESPNLLLLLSCDEPGEKWRAWTAGSILGRTAKLLLLFTFFAEFFRGVHDFSGSLEDMEHRRIPQAVLQPLLTTLIIKLMDLFVLVAESDWRVLKQFHYAINRLCESALTTVFHIVSGSPDEFSSKSNILASLRSVVRIGMTHEDTLADSLRLTWRYIGGLKTVLSNTSSIDMLPEVVSDCLNSIKSRVTGYLVRRGHTMAWNMPAALLAPLVHDLTFEFGKFCTFLNKIVTSSRGDGCNNLLESLVSEVHLKTAAIIAFTSLCLPEAATFQAGLRLTTSLLPVLCRRGCFSGGMLPLWRLNASLLLCLISVRSQENRRTRLASVFGQLSILAGLQQTAALKIALHLTPGVTEIPEEPGDGELLTRLGNRILNCGPASRAHLVSVLSTPRMRVKDLTRALNSFVNQCA